jgi:hypothetical protein
MLDELSTSLTSKEYKMSKLIKFQTVSYCHAMRNHGWSVEVIASRLECPVEDVNLMLESSPVGASVHG